MVCLRPKEGDVAMEQFAVKAFIFSKLITDLQHERR